MKTAYQEYMDWQTVSSDLHSKLLALELEQKASVPAPVRPLKLSRHGWHRVAALAASLVLVVGLGFFVAQSGLPDRAGDSSAMESAVVTQAPAAAEAFEGEAEPGNNAVDMGSAVEEAAAEAPTADTAQEESMPAFEEPAEAADDRALEWAEQNAALLMETLSFSDEDAVLGAAQRLEQAGCGRITEIAVEEDDGRVYVLNLTDEEQNVFHTVMDYEGYIGPIQDEDGNYLYAPIE